MAIYKPSNSTPFLNAIDLTEPQDVQCELSTSNVNIVGYKMKILDNNNNEVFKGENFTELDDPSLYNYFNTGENGSILNLPMVVTDPNQSNENNIFFTGYNWGRWKPQYKTLSTKIAYYYYGQYYFRISRDTMTTTEYGSLSNIYKKVNGCYRKVDTKPTTISEAERLQYYYLCGTKNKYTKINKEKVSELDYLQLDRIFVMDNTNRSYEANLLLVTSATTEGDTIKNKASISVDLHGAIRKNVSPERPSISDIFFVNGSGSTAQILSYSIKIDESDKSIITCTVETSEPNCYVSAVIKYEYGGDSIVGQSGDFHLSYPTPTKAQAKDDAVYYHPYKIIGNYTGSRSEYDDADVLYQRAATAEKVYDGTNNPSKDMAELEELYYKRYFYELPYRPSLSISYNKYYYKDDYNNMVLITGNKNYMLFNDKDRENISLIEAINEGYYYKDGTEYKLITSEMSESDFKQKGLIYKLYEYDGANSNILTIYDTSYNFYMMTSAQRPRTFDEAKGQGYYYKEYYNIEGIKPDWTSKVKDHLNEFFVLVPITENENSEGNLTDIKVVTLQEAEINEKTKYEEYIGTIYTKKGSYNPLLDSDINNTVGYSYYKSIDTLTADEYEDIPAIFSLRYISIQGLDEEYYENEIYDLYKLKTKYVPVVDKNKKPTYSDSQGKYYYLSDEFVPITQSYCEYDSISEFYVHDDGEYFVINKNYTTGKEAYNDGAFISNYKEVLLKPSKSVAIFKGYYYFVNAKTRKDSAKYLKIDYDMSDSEYNTLKTVYELVGMTEYNDVTDSLSQPIYRKVENFYNGYLYQPYKWQLSLQQGDIGVTEPEEIRSKWYDMTITSGKVIGSLSSRIQGIYSEEIYSDYYIQLVDKDKTQIGNRVRIKTYDYSFGYLYPQDGSFADSDVEKASYFCIYKDTNDPEVISSSRKVDWCTTHTIDVAIGSATVKDSFKRESDFSKYFIQTYNGTVSVDDINMKIYDDNGLSNETMSLGTTTILLKDQENGAFNGVFTLASIDTKDSVTTLKWLRAANADTYADFINKSWFISQGTYSGKNMTSDAEAGQGVINTTPLNFSEEKPIKIYPTPEDKYKNEYADTFTYEDRKVYSPIFKNSNTRTFIRPFVGISEDMRFKYGLNDYEAVLIKSVNTDLWYITHDSLPYNLILTPNTTDYTISSYYKNSDENPFFGYRNPYIEINIENLTTDFSDDLLPIVANRYVESSAVYSQEQNKSWKNFQWTLQNLTQDLVAYQTNVSYSGSFSNKFVGLENTYEYKLSITIENELGVVQTVSKDFAVFVDVESNLLPLSAELDCNNTQSINFSFVGDGIIIPNYQDVNYSNRYMEIGDDKYDKEVGNSYNSILFNNRQIALPAPINNSFTLNSEHILSQYFEGKIIELEFDDQEFSSSTTAKPLDGDIRYKLVVDSGTDTEIIKSDDVVSEIVKNDKRNKLTVGLFKEKYDGNAWTKIKEYGDNFGLNIQYVDQSKPAGATKAGEWRELQPVVFSLGRAKYRGDKGCDDKCDYLYTTAAYETTIDSTTGLKKQTQVTGWHYLASKEYNQRDPDTEKYKISYRYGSDSESWELKEISGIGKINFCPLVAELPEEGIDDTNYGVYFDQQVKALEQADGTARLITNDEAAIWSDKDNGNNVLFWSDKDSKYGCYKQTDLNEPQNHSGRQNFANYKITLSVPVTNYDSTLDTGGLVFSPDSSMAFFSKNE